MNFYNEKCSRGKVLRFLAHFIPLWQCFVTLGNQKNHARLGGLILVELMSNVTIMCDRWFNSRKHMLCVDNSISRQILKQTRSNTDWREKYIYTLFLLFCVVQSSNRLHIVDLIYTILAIIIKFNNIVLFKIKIVIDFRNLKLTFSYRKVPHITVSKNIINVSKSAIYFEILD